MVQVHVSEGDLSNSSCDLLILKYADSFHGVDERISNAIGFYGDLQVGNHAFVRGKNLESTNVLFIGVGPLVDFRYEKIRLFAALSLQIASSSTARVKKICSPIHGPGYGLDDREAFLSLISGFYDAIDDRKYPADLEEIEVVESNPARASRLQKALELYKLSRDIKSSRKTTNELKQSSFGAKSEEKKRVFVAMPFSGHHSDVWDIAIQEACANGGIIAERIDAAAFVGDILSEIKTRLEHCSALIALLDDANPNVFLEIGYAWALKKPTILLASSAAKLPFDIRGQKCIIFPNLKTLRNLLTEELRSLLSQRVI